MTFRQAFKSIHADSFALPLPEGHRCPMSKYARLRERYVHRVTRGELTPQESRRIGVPWSPASNLADIQNVARFSLSTRRYDEQTAQSSLVDRRGGRRG